MNPGFDNAIKFSESKLFFCFERCLEFTAVVTLNNVVDTFNRIKKIAD